MYDEQQVGPESPTEQATVETGSSVNWPTVMMAAGVSAVISAIVLAIGLVGLLLSDVGNGRAAAVEAPATVVNLGAQQGQPQAVAPAATSSAAASEAPSAPTPAAAAPDQAQAAPAPAASSAGTPATAEPQAASAPTAPTAAQLQADLDYLSSGASNAQKAQRLEGGARAVGQAQGILGLAKRFKPMGFAYQVVDPVAVSGETATARIKFSSPGYQPTYLTLKWVWQDGRWKLTNGSVCELGSYASIPCNL